MKDKTSLILIGIIVVLALVLFVGCKDDKPVNQGDSFGEPTEINVNKNVNQEPEERDLMSDLRNAKTIAWIAPHCDDEIFVGGMLSYAGLGLNKKTYVISMHKGGVAFPPGATRDDRLADNQDFKNLVGLTDYVYGEFDDYPRNKEIATKMYLEDIVDELGIDLIFTFENTNGAYGHKEHIQVSGWVTEFARENNIKLYYMINREPSVRAGKDSHMDPLPVTDTFDLEKYSLNTRGVTAR